VRKDNFCYVIVKKRVVISIIFILLFFLFIKSSYADDCIVSKVVDGDTIWCTFPDKSTKVRMLAIDTPEITNGKNECYGQEAAEWLSNKILNKKVGLEYDKDEPTYGNYGRLLAFIWINNQNINFEMIKLGYAKALTKYPIHRYSIKKIVELELEAINNNVGLWKDCY